MSGTSHGQAAQTAPTRRPTASSTPIRLRDAEPGEMIYDGRGIDGVLTREAMTRQLMDGAANVVIGGCASTGKSYLACRIAKQACRVGYEPLADGSARKRP